MLIVSEDITYEAKSMTKNRTAVISGFSKLNQNEGMWSIIRLSDEPNLRKLVLEQNSELAVRLLNLKEDQFDYIRKYNTLLAIVYFATGIVSASCFSIIFF